MYDLGFHANHGSYCFNNLNRNSWPDSRRSRLRACSRCGNLLLNRINPRADTWESQSHGNRKLLQLQSTPVPASGVGEFALLSSTLARRPKTANQSQNYPQREKNPSPSQVHVWSFHSGRTNRPSGTVHLGGSVESQLGNNDFCTLTCWCSRCCLGRKASVFTKTIPLYCSTKEHSNLECKQNARGFST